MVSILIPLYGQLLQVIGYIETGTDIKYDKKEEVVNMCKAWDDHKKRGIQEGRLFEIYLSVQEGDYSAKRGAEKAEMSLDEFEKAMSKAGYKIPELV